MAACDGHVRQRRGAAVRARKHTAAAQSSQGRLRASGSCCLVSGFQIRGREWPSGLCSSLSALLATLEEEWKVRRTRVGDAVTVVTEAERLLRVPGEEHLRAV